MHPPSSLLLAWVRAPLEVLVEEEVGDLASSAVVALSVVAEVLLFRVVVVFSLAEAEAERCWA